MAATVPDGGGVPADPGVQTGDGAQPPALLTTDQKLDALNQTLATMVQTMNAQTATNEQRFQQQEQEILRAAATQQPPPPPAPPGNIFHQWAESAAQAGQAAMPIASASPATLKPPTPPKFRGAYKEPRVLEWSHQVSQYLLSAGLAETIQGIFHASAFLADEAATWWRLYCARVERKEVACPLNWWGFRALIIEQFSETNRLTTLRDRFAKIQQKTTVAKYIAEFQAIVLELPEKSEGDQVHQFVRGLKKQVQLHTRTQSPTTLDHAMRIADEADRAIFDVGGSTSSFVGKSRGKGPEPMQLNAATLTPEQKARCVDEGLCFNCMKPGHSARFCPSKGSGKGKGKKTSGRRGKGSRPAAGN